MSNVLENRMLIVQRQLRPGAAEAVVVKSGQLVQIVDVAGKQVADCVIFSLADRAEWGSTGVTRSENGNIMLTLGKQFYSNRRRPLVELAADTVGRHDMLYACCDPARYVSLGGEAGHANCRGALANALAVHDVSGDEIPDPINWFMNVAIKQRGELEIREPLSGPNDYVVIKALQDVIVAVSACPQDLNKANGAKPTDIVVRVFA